MDRFYSNITGCIRYADYLDAAKWLDKAKAQLDDESYLILLRKVFYKYPLMANSEHFAHFKISDNLYISKDERILQVSELLNTGNYEDAEALYSKFLSYKDFPDFHQQREASRQRCLIRNFKECVKKELNITESELLIDVETLLENNDKLFFRRIETRDANFYFTKSANYDLTIFKRKNKFVRYLPWNHALARGVLSTELNQISDHGLVSFIGNYVPEKANLKSVTYLTKDGRHYFDDAVKALTTKAILPSKSGLIDIDSFMRMKEVIPTASQMRAIYTLGNHIIDGPAGTGKSTSILQKILVLLNDHKLSESQIIVMVKHQGLVRPFEDLLKQMSIEGVEITTVGGFLRSQLGENYNRISARNINDLVEVSSILKTFLKQLLSHEQGGSFLDIPECLDEEIIFNLMKEYHTTRFDRDHLLAKKAKRESELLKPYTKQLEYSISSKQEDLSNVLNRTKYSRALKIDADDRSKLKAEQLKYNTIWGLRSSSSGVERSEFDSLLITIQNKLFELEQKISGEGINKNIPIVLHDYINQKISDELQDFKALEYSKLDQEFRLELNDDEIFLSIKADIDEVESRLLSLFNQIETTAFNNVVGYTDVESISLLKCSAGKINNKWNTIIIDEAQDVPSVHIELVGFFSQQLILSGDEAQNENPNGLGFWHKLRDETGFYRNGELTLYKLKHNFRQTYELGNLSYNFRQLMLGHTIEDLREEYFENQKGFDKPIVKIYEKLIDVIVDRLEFIRTRFNKKFPLVIIYENNAELLLSAKQLDINGLSFSIEQVKNQADIILLNAKQVAGKEFPVVISMTNDRTKDSTLYIMLSRAKFNLTIMVPSFSSINEKLKILAQHDMVIR